MQQRPIQNTHLQIPAACACALILHAASTRGACRARQVLCSGSTKPATSKTEQHRASKFARFRPSSSLSPPPPPLLHVRSSPPAAAVHLHWPSTADTPPAAPTQCPAVGSGKKKFRGEHQRSLVEEGIDGWHFEDPERAATKPALQQPLQRRA